MSNGVRGFSLLELVIVLVIIGVIAAVAIPRMSSAAANSTTTAVAASTSEVQHAIELYSTEHQDRNPAIDASGSVDPKGDAFIDRLLHVTDDMGTVDGAGIFGPYLRAWPPNAANGLSTVRIGGAAAGANTDGWRFDPANGTFLPDHDKVGKGGGVGALGGGSVGGGGATAIDPGP